MNRFIHHHQLIRYNHETREQDIKNWGKYNLHKGGKPVIDCILSELKEVEDTSLIAYVAENIVKEDIQVVYESFCGKEEEETEGLEEDDESFDDTLTTRSTIGGQKEKEKHKEKENKKQQQKDLYPNLENNLQRDSSKKEDVKEITECWDQNGFGYSNINAKQQLLLWLYDSSFLNPKAVIIKAMEIACSNNKRRLNYVVGILKNRENESLLTVEEIDLYNENNKRVTEQRRTVKTDQSGIDVPTEFELEITAGEDW
jgi:DnaD/phage-associated family protein